LRSLTQHWALEAFSLKQRGDGYFFNYVEYMQTHQLESYAYTNKKFDKD